jgi:TonB-linked SusC/RagA family outer membrane protein
MMIPYNLTLIFMEVIYLQFRKVWLFLGLIAAYATVYGQIPVKGKVLSADENQGLPGVNIVIKGTNQGVITGSDGTYSISVRNKENVLVFSSIGYITEEEQVGDRTTIDLLMVPDIKELETIVVMGYSTKKRSEITSAVTTVSSDKLMDVTSNDIGTMLQGKVSGIQVINSSGAPGATSEIRIRGISSFSAPQGPLYVVDGIIGGTFDPNDVETITVLKDAGATGMYGSQANGGVVVVSTKKAKSDKPQFEFKAVTGYRVADHGNVEMMDSKTLYAYHREFFRDPQKFVVDDRKFKAARPASLLEVNTDWLSETFKPAMIQNYFMSSAGRSDKLSYYIGASYYDEKGTFINTDFKRANLRANTTYKFSEKVSLTNNINISGSKNIGTDDMNIYYAYVNMPWDNPYDENGKARSFKTAEGIWSKDKINPIQTAQNSELSSKAFSFDYDIDLNIKILDWLSFASTNRLSAYTSMDQTYYAKAADNFVYYGLGYVSSQSSFNYSGITTDLFKFNFDGPKHSFSGLVGFEAQGGNDDYIFGSGMGIPEGLRVPSVASGQYLISGSPTKSVMQSFISQVNYNYTGKYFLSASYRIDQSSQFAPNKRTAKFPSVSAAWLLSNEDFVRNISAISNLKLKASWGKTGMKDIGPYRYMEMFSFSSQYDGQPAAVPTQMANPDLTWEQTDQFNAGLEIGLLNRIDLELNLYRNMTKDLLVERALPPSGGFRTQWQNIGKDMNSGVELSINAAVVKTKDFNWSVDFSFGYNKNKLSGFGNDTIITSNNYGILQVYHDGASLYSWYAKEYYGIDPADGSMLWVDKNGETTHEYQDARYIEYGSPMPKFQGGFATEIRYKAISLRGTFSYLSGNKIFNYFRRYVDHDLNETQFNVMMPSDDYKLWQSPGDIATKPLPQNARNSFDPSTRFIDDGSFLKVRNITLSYELPQSLVSKVKVKGITLSLSADNVYTFTDFWGQDPEVSITPSYGYLPGYAEFKYPNNRQYLASLNIRF